jgi:hypothetical protein
MHRKSAKKENSGDQRSLTDPWRALAKKLAVVTELRRLRNYLGLGAREPIAALPLATASDASGASFVPGHAPVDASGRGRIDANALHHAVHQLGVAKDPIQHRAAVTEITHGISSALVFA